jgi:hypothetical protein
MCPSEQAAEVNPRVAGYQDRAEASVAGTSDVVT